MQHNAQASSYLSSVSMHNLSISYKVSIYMVSAFHKINLKWCTQTLLWTTLKRTEKLHNYHFIRLI